MPRLDKPPPPRAPEEAPEEDFALFRRMMQDVQPLPERSARVPPARRAVRARARFARAERASVLRESLEGQPGAAAGVTAGVDLYDLQPGDELQFRRPGVPPMVLTRLRRGHYRIDSEIDLHGLTVAEARTALGAFLHEAQTRHLRCLRIVHGKGLRSGQRGPVLKNWVNMQLRRANAVLAFASARPAAGGTGATLVLLADAHAPRR